jgi:hypothetical protein
MRSRRNDIGYALIAGALSLLIGGCGTFEIRGQLVTVTTTADAVPTKTPITQVIPTVEATVEATRQPSPTGEPARLNLPRLDDAQIVVDIGTRLIYRSESELEDAQAFYQRQMPLEGWTLLSESSEEINAFLTFQRGDETVTITITVDWLGLTVEAQGDEA